MMGTLRFWIAALSSGILHAGALSTCLLVAWLWHTPAMLLEPYGDSDREGFNVATVSLDPGTERQGDDNTPGGEVATSKLESPPPPDDPPQNVEPSPLPPPLPETLAPVVPPDPIKPETSVKPPETTAVPVAEPKSKPPATNAGSPGAAGGAKLPQGTPSKGGLVGKPTGVKFLRAGRKFYPAEAARLGQEGTPLVWLRISERGDVIEVKLHQSCGYPLLDAAALRFATTMKFRPALGGDTPVESIAIQPVEYELP